MFSTFKNHPFAVEAFFEQSIVLTFAYPKEQIAHLLPSCLSLDIYDNEWGFIAVAIVKTKNLRLKGFLKFLGNDFKLIGYRVFVRYTNDKGKRLRGLYILKSETDKVLMELIGNFFTQYSYTTTDIIFRNTNEHLNITSLGSDLSIELKLDQLEVALPETSPFKDWKEARRFAGPLPFTFTYKPNTREVLIVEGVRENWVPKPVEIINHQIGFLNTGDLRGGTLANAFIIDNIPYHWKKGKIEIWKQ
jgi:hypothetical protein